MTPAEQQAVLRYVGVIQDRMRLNDWTIRINFEEPAGENAYASITFTDKRKQASIRFCSDFRTLTAQQIRHTVVHELLHVHMQQTWKFLDFQASSWMTQASYDAWNGSASVMFEYTVDGIADGWAVDMPLIEWPEEPEGKADNEQDDGIGTESA